MTLSLLQMHPPTALGSDMTRDDAYRIAMNAVRIAAARSSFIAAQTVALTAMLAQRPTNACVAALDGSGEVPIGADFVAWVRHNGAEVDRQLAECIWDAEARNRLTRRYTAARARAECALLPDTCFGGLSAEESA